MNIQDILQQVVILFLIMLIGYIARKTNILDENMNKKLSNLLLMVTAPLLVIASFCIEFSKTELMNAVYIFIFSIVSHGIGIFLASLFYKKQPSDKRSVLRFSTIFANCGFLGYPILMSIYGSIGIFYGSVFVIGFNIFIYSYGVILYSDNHKLDMKMLLKALLNPGLIGVAIGLVIFLFSIELPEIIYKPIRLVGDMTIPLSMLIVGSILGGVKLKGIIEDAAMFMPSVLRLLIIPVIIWGVIRLIPYNFSDAVVGTAIMLSAMPVAANTAIFASKYGANSDYASKIVAVSTICCIITIPLIVLLIAI